MPTRNVVLTVHQQELIDTLVGAGRYQNASEVLREGLRLVEQREAEDAARIEALRAAAQVGWDAYDAGNYVELTNEDELKSYLRERGQRARARYEARQHTSA